MIVDKGSVTLNAHICIQGRQSKKKIGQNLHIHVINGWMTHSSSFKRHQDCQF